ncbi:MAG TPA: hypothetical protein VNO30_11170 [Kofleriaceae bacterium]|nr:hypothetical protein [Kofleriaceae bacterium]
MSKDRAAPFSRKHRRYWLPVTGGMLLIGAINLALGYCAYDPPSASTEKIELVIPPSPYTTVAPAAPAVPAVPAVPDAGVDAAAALTAPPPAATPR